MDNDADAKKAFQDFVTNVKQKLDDAKPIFEKLNRQLTVYSTSADIKRVRDRLAAVSNRLQLLTL
jgi:division protein CdvB (Snf7/Vps24/ESCRT-III family)